MLLMNHTISKVLALLRTGKSLEEIDGIIPTLLLPDALRMYGPRQVFHFTEHPLTGKVSTVTFHSTPNNLKGIKDTLEKHLQENIPQAAVDESSHPEIFKKLNPNWIDSQYETHLHQDFEWDRWIRTLVDVSKRFDDEFVYNRTGKVVNGATFRRDLAPLNDKFFISTVQKIKSEYNITIDADWFEKHVHQILLKNYDEELAENTWKYIDIPTVDKAIVLPEFVTEMELNSEIDRIVDASK